MKKKTYVYYNIVLISFVLLYSGCFNKTNSIELSDLNEILYCDDISNVSTAKYYLIFHPDECVSCYLPGIQFLKNAHKEQLLTSENTYIVMPEIRTKELVYFIENNSLIEFNFKMALCDSLFYAYTNRAPKFINLTNNESYWFKSMNDTNRVIFLKQ
jgi:hypothetical protein